MDTSKHTCFQERHGVVLSDLFLATREAHEEKIQPSYRIINAEKTKNEEAKPYV